MKRTRAIALIPVCFAALLASGPADAADIDPAVSAAAQAGALPRVLVILGAQADLSGASSIRARKEKGALVFGKLREAAAQTQGPLLARARAMGLTAKPFFIMNAIYVEARPGASITPQQLAALGADPAVARIRSAEVQAELPVEKKNLTAHDTENYAGPLPNIVQIGAPAVWAKGYTGQGVVIGFIDTGEDATHPDIATKYRGYAGAGQPTNDNYNFFDPSTAPCPSPVTGNPTPCDTDGHGTHVTGTAVGSNPVFQIGVAPGAQWIGCRALGPGSTVSTILTCLQWMLAPTDVLGNNPDPTQAPDIVNNSYFCSGCNIDYAFTALRNAGIVPVAAIGNLGPYCLSAVEPGGYQDVVGVGAVFANGKITAFSSTGPYIDYNDNLIAKPNVTAPGAGIVSALANTAGYTTEDGTSMASPHVAGEIALLLSANPSLDFLSGSSATPLPADFAPLLAGVTGGANATLNSACDLGGTVGNVYGAGTINVPNALQILLGASPLLVTSFDNGELPAGAPLSIPVSATGGTPAYSWALTGPGILPAGLTFSAGVLGGTPSFGGSSFLQFQVTDSAHGSDTAFINLSVMGLTTTVLPAGVVGTAYFATPGAAGGTGTYSFQFSCLPAGLSDDGMGDITGTPTQTGAYSVCVTVNDGTTTATQKLALTIGIVPPPPPLLVLALALPPGIVGQQYSQPAAAASGGVPPYYWSLATGNLPAGLTLERYGIVDGVPSKGGTSTFSFTVTDSANTSATGSATLTIALPPLTVVVPALPAGMKGVAYPLELLSAQGGTGPYTFSSTPAVPGLPISAQGAIAGTPSAAGTYAVTVTASDTTGRTGTASFNIVVRPFSSELLLTTGEIDFVLAAGATALPPAQAASLQSAAVSPLPYSVSMNPQVNWLTLSQAEGNAPGLLTASLNSQALALPAASSAYQTTVSIVCLAPAPCAGNVQTVAVKLTVATLAPRLNTLSDLISFTGGTNAQTVGIQDAGGGSIGFGSISCAAAWCTVAGVPGSIGGGQTATLTVTVDPSSLPPGLNRTAMTVISSAGKVSVPVTALITALPVVSLEPAGALFQSIASGQLAAGGSTSFLIATSSATPVSWTATVLPGANWLTVTSPSGTAFAAQSGTVNYSLNGGIVAGLPSGTYYGAIRVVAAGAANTPQDFPVILNVAPSGSVELPSPAPSGLLFTGKAAFTPGFIPRVSIRSFTGDVSTQIVSVPNMGASALGVAASANTNDGANWLSVTPAIGSAAPGDVLQTHVTANPSGLAPGVYTGSVNYSTAGLGVRSVDITLVVPGTGSCIPSRLAAAQVGLVNGFAQPVAWPAPVEVLLTDDCGNPVTFGQIAAVFSNGDPALRLTLADPASGLYAATWTPRNPSQQVAVTLTALAPGLASASQQLIGVVTPNGAPLLSPNSTQSLFNPQAGGSVAPGGIVQISGTGFSSQSTVTIGGLSAPVTAATANTITAEVPTELAPGTLAQVIVTENGATSMPDTVFLAAVSPGISTVAHADGMPVTESSPAAPGEALTLTAAGLGVTSPPVPDGVPSPSTPQATVVDTPSMTLDGSSVSITSAVLQAGTVGIYQVGFIVPQNARSGDLTLILTQPGNMANAAVVPVRGQ